MFKKKLFKVFNFIVKEIVFKTVLLCFISTFITFIFLIINPTDKDQESKINISISSEITNPQHRNLSNTIAKDVHQYWLKHEFGNINYRASPLFEYYMTKDIAKIVSHNPDLYLNKNRLQQQKFLYYFRWVSQLIKGDLGFSKQGLSINKELSNRLPTTLFIALGALFFILCISFSSSLVSVLKNNRNSRFQDFLLYFVSSIPSFVIGYFFIRILMVKHYTNVALIFPIVALTISNGLIAEFITVINASLNEEISKKYYLFATTKGFDKKHIIQKHVTKNSFLSVLPHIGQKTSFIIGGTLVIEKVFSMNGIADMLIDGLGRHDIPRVLVVILAATLFIRVSCIFFEFLNIMLNPKIDRI